MQTGLFKLAVVAGAMTLAMMGCTQERPYEVKPKPAQQEGTEAPKSLITEATNTPINIKNQFSDDLYLYLPSTVNVTRTTTAARPHWMGDAKLVKLKFTKDALNVYEVERDERYQDNVLNNSPVLSIPVEHVDYRCETDADGKCTNREIVNEDVTWDKKRYFQVKTDELNVHEVNFFPEQLMNLFGDCTETLSTEFAHYEVSEKAILIQVDKVYRAGRDCLAGINSLSDINFRVRYSYSLVKLNQLISPDYRPLVYRPGEENTFGFFTTTNVALDPDNNTTIGSETVLVNRWKPGRTVVYHLSESFNEPQNARLKAATLAAVDTINQSLAKAKTGLRIQIAEPSKVYKQGDLRLNTIVLEEDPLGVGVIGYGPSVANPLTGEIVNARTVMYLGTLKKYLKESYDELVIEKLSKKSGSSLGASVSPASFVAIAQSGRHAGAANLVFNQNILAQTQKMKESTVQDTLSGLLGPLAVQPAMFLSRTELPDIKPVMDIQKAVDAVRNNRLVTRASTDTKAQLENLMRVHCMYDAELFNFHAAIENEIDDLIVEMRGRLWNQLNVYEQEKVLDVLLPFVWVPTLVHELGHNLGLRHNFGGSEDKDNFYTPQELRAMGIERQFAYSSVMDYSYRTTNELSVMGKYDIAALRFGYAEEVELDNGKFVSLHEFRTKGGTLKPYKFCTDEHVGLNPNCNVFDEGTNLTEIAQHHINAYYENYHKRNFRNNRLSFSLYSDLAYARSISHGLDSIRAMFERYEFIKRALGIPEDHPVWEQNAFLKDLKSAVTLSAAFLADIIQTPDVLCAAATREKPTQIVGLVPLRMLSPFAITCFDEENIQIPGYVMVAQGGKMFQSMKDPKSTNKYIDQIDVRGIWIDKLLALDALVSRKTGIRTFDTFNDNMLDVAHLAGPVREALERILADRVVTKVRFVTRLGQVLDADLGVKLYDVEDGKNGHIIETPISLAAQQVFGIRDHVPFQVKVVETLKATLKSRDQINDINSLYNSIRVTRLKPSDTGLRKGYVGVEIGPDLFVAHESARVATHMMDAYLVTSLLTRIGEDRVAAILEDVQKGRPAPADANEDIRRAYTLPAETLKEFLTGGYQSPQFYVDMIRAMVDEE